MNPTLSQKTRHKNVPTKRLISIIIDRYLAAPAVEQKAIVEFFNWAIRNSLDLQLKDLYIEVKSRILEVRQ